MPTERYFLDDSFKVHELKEIGGSEFHHLSHVMRTRKGDEVELVNGKGYLAQAVVQEVRKDKAVLIIGEVFQEADHAKRIILAQAMPKPNRLDFILEKGTELGVDDFWIFPGQLSAKKDIYPHQIERAHTVTIAAMKQCGRLTLPSFTIQPELSLWPSFENMCVFFGDVRSDAPTLELAWEKLKPHNLPVVFITGPEGGFSTKELELLKNKGAIGVKLHSNILRTETASLMALSLLWTLLSK